MREYCEYCVFHITNAEKVFQIMSQILVCNEFDIHISYSCQLIPPVKLYIKIYFSLSQTFVYIYISGKLRVT